MSARPTLSSLGVVIVTYESATTLRQTLDQLPTKELGGVVVVDNASTDGCADLAETCPNVDVVRNDRNFGYGQACNQGRRRLGPEINAVLFLNPDCEIHQSDLTRLLSYIESTRMCGLVAPRLRDAAGWLTSAGRMATFATELWHVLPPRLAVLLPQRRYDPSFDRTGAVGYVEGACMLFRARSFDEIGGFDERYFLFYEELDVAQRLSRCGYTVDLFAASTAHHVRAVSRAALGSRSRVEMWRSAVLYLDRWHGRWQVSLFRALGMLYLLERVLRKRMDRRLAQSMLAGLRTDAS